MSTSQRGRARDRGIRRRARSGARAALVSLALCALASGCGRERVLVVGIDGADPSVVGPLIEEGRLPNLARIAREGASGPLRSIAPYQSPRVWTTVATGRVPEEHGITGFFRREGEAARPSLFVSGDRTVPALWNIASARGLRVGVVNWWTTFPPERVEGVMLSDHLLPAKTDALERVFNLAEMDDGPLAYPPEWEEIAAERIAADEPPSATPDPFAAEPDLPSWGPANGETEDGPGYLSGVYLEDATVTRLALEVQRRIDPDLLMVLLTGVDRVSHVLWGAISPAESYPPRLRPSDAERAAGRRAIHRYYEHADALLGRLMERLGARDHVVVLSDHGIEPRVTLGGLTGGHVGEAAANGILFAMGPRIEAGAGTEGLDVLDIMPTLLALLALPLAEDMEGEPAPFVTALPEERVASYDDTPVERLEGSSGVETEMIDALRALGYGE